MWPFYFFCVKMTFLKHDTTAFQFHSWSTSKSNMILYCFLIGKFPEVEMVKEQFLHTSANNSSLVLGSGDDATPSLHCFANNKRHAKGSAVAHIVVLRPEKDATSPHSLVFIPPAPPPPFFSPLISIVTVLSHARASVVARCHILLLSSCLEVSLSQVGRVELLWVLPAFARCSFGVGS